jgi:hypothetical protein
MATAEAKLLVRDCSGASTPLRNRDGARFRAVDGALTLAVRAVVAGLVLLLSKFIIFGQHINRRRRQIHFAFAGGGFFPFGFRAG